MSEKLIHFNDGEVVEDIMMRVRTLDESSAKQSLEDQEMQVHRAAVFLQEHHQQLNSVDATLHQNAEHLNVQ